MKVSQATTKIKDTQKTYLIRVVISLILLYILNTFLCFMYILPYYFNVFWKGMFSNGVYSLYSSETYIQIILFVVVCLIITLASTIIALVIYYKNNIEYQNEYIKIVYDELALNSIYLVNKRIKDENVDMDFIYKSLGLKNIEREHLYTFKSLFDMSFYQLYTIFHRRKDYSLLISSKIEKGIDGYVQIRFNSKYTIDNYEEKDVYQYTFSDTKKYSYDIFVNSSTNKETYRIIDDNVLKTMLELKKFTNVNLVVTLTKNLFYVWIPGWEMKLTDNLFKKLSYDKMDKKVEIFTELIDEILDLYIYLINKEDVWDKKW